MEIFQPYLKLEKKIIMNFIKMKQTKRTLEFDEDPEIDFQLELEKLENGFIDYNLYQSSSIKLEEKSRTFLSVIPTDVEGTYNLIFQNEFGWKPVKKLESIDLTEVDMIIVGDCGFQLKSFTTELIDKDE